MAVQELLILQPVDFAHNEIRQVRLESLASAPSSPAEGWWYYDSSLHEAGYYNGTSWVYSTTVPDATGSVKGILKLAGDLGGTAASPTVVGLSLSGDTAINHKLTAVTDPTAGSQEAATAHYVDAAIAVAISGIKYHSVRAATTANITISTALNNGDTLDGVTLATNDLVLVKNQTSAAENGVYIVQASPARASFMDSAGEVDGTTVVVEDGTVGAGKVWITTSEVTTLGTDAISWTKIFDIGDLVAGAGLTLTGSTLTAHVDGTTIDTSGSGSSLEVKTGGITTTQIADGTITSTDISATASILRSQLAAAVQFALTLFVDVVATSNVSITSAPSTIDGHTMAAGELVLLTNQTTTTQNGIYVFAAASSAMSRSGLMPNASVAVGGQLILAYGGAGIAQIWKVSGSGNLISGSYVVGTDTVPFDVVYRQSSADPTAPSNGAVSAGLVAQARIVRFELKGDGSTTAFVCTHSFGSKQVAVTAQADSSGPFNDEKLSWTPTSTSAVTVEFPVAPVAGVAHYITVTG